MDARAHFRAAEQALDWAREGGDEDRGSGRDLSFLLEALTHAQLATAAALGADTDPPDQATDRLADDARLVPLLRIPTRLDRPKDGA